MIRNIAFILSMLLYIGFPIQMISSYESVLAEGEVFRFKPRPVDPYHPFQGRYVSLRYEDMTLAYEGARDVFERGTLAYVSLEKDEFGIAHAKTISPDPPAEGPFVRVEVGWTGDKEVNFDYPFDEYYMNEEMAPLAETEVQKFSRRDKEEVYIDVRIKDGIAVIEQLYVKDTPIEEFLRQIAE